jgi:nucleoside-diphosphate-sugar epimerase
MKILITGATGFVGRYLTPKLLHDGHQVLELTRDVIKSDSIFGNQTIKFDLKASQEELNSCVENFQPDVCIHLASYLTSSDAFVDAKKLIETNIIFLVSVLESLKNVNLKLFINTGTFAEYFKGDGVLDPAYLYAATKSASRYFVDYYSKNASYKYATVVPYTIYGAKDSQKKIIDLIVDSLDSTIPLDLSPGEQVLDFIHIKDVVDFYSNLINKTEQIEDKTVFSLGTGVGHTLKKLAIIVNDVTGKIANVNWGGKPYRSSDVMYAVADTLNMDKILDDNHKITLEQGVKNYLTQING